MDKEQLQKDLGTRIRYLRRKKDITQTELGDAIDMTTSYICETEKGKRPISSYYLHKFESELGDIWDHVMKGGS